jgi:hypothetical protein
MKKFALLLIALFVVSAICHKHHKHQDDDDNEDNENSSGSCGLYSQNAYFDLSSLSLTEGAWEYTNYDGNTYFFNFCGDLENAGSGCSDSVAVCIKTPYGNSLNAGRPYGDWSASDDETQIIGSFSSGDACNALPGQTISTVIQLTCSEDLLTVYNVNYTGCQVLIQAFSSAACAQPPPEPDVVVFPFFFSLICTLSLCLCCITCCFRSRRAKLLAQRKGCKKSSYQRVPTQVTVADSKPVQQQPQQQMPYYYVPYNNSIQNVSAVPYPYYQPPMNGGYMYPQFMYAAPQAPEATLIPLDFASNSMEASRLAAQEKEDERLARELQSKYNQEQ